MPVPKAVATLAIPTVISQAVDDDIQSGRYFFHRSDR